MIPRDTSPAAHAAQMAARRRLTPEQRLELAVDMADDLRDRVRAGIVARHPGYSPDEVEAALRRLMLGDALFRAAWPSAPLLAP